MRARFAVVGVVLVAACSGGTEAVTTTGAAVPASPSTTSSTTSSSAATTTTSEAVTSTTSLSPLTGLAYEQVDQNLPFPIFLGPRADGVSFLITKGGEVWEQTRDGFEPFLDISGRVGGSFNEQGLLGMAWHPTDPDRLFLHYSDNRGDTVISEFNGEVERVLLAASQPATNHNGGMIAFGPDGYLYIALGDGGGSNDRFGTAQRADDLLGSILRIDVDGDPYLIPPGNPYSDSDGADEVWAIGLRNPWRFWFDNDLLYIADVGQNAYEEINVAPAAAAGLNYGWPMTEAMHCFSPRSGCDTGGVTLPVLEISHDDAGTCSIAGGVVYRGQAIPELSGHYFYSDLCGGYLRSFLYAGGEVTEPRDWTDLAGVPGQVISFGTDAAGEMYVLTTDAVLRIVPGR